MSEEPLEAQSPNGDVRGSRAIRIDSEVHRELTRLRGDAPNFSEPIRLLLEKADLERRLTATGLTTQDMGRLWNLRAWATR